MSENKQFVFYGGSIPLANKITVSLGKFLFEKLASLGDSVLFIDGNTDQQITASELLWESIQLANSLKRNGVTVGDKVGIFSENRFEFANAVLATLYLGATITTFSPAYTESELTHTTNLSRPKVVFGSPAVIETLSKVATKSKFIKTVVVFASNTNHSNVISYNAFLRQSMPMTPSQFRCTAVNPKENSCLIMYSSGTTGLPKGVELTQANTMCILQQRIDTVNDFEDIVLTVIPWTHNYGFGVLLTLICNYKKSVFLPRFNERQYLSCIQKYKITTAFTAPPLLVFLAKTPILSEYNVSSIKLIISRSAPLAQSVVTEINKRFNNPKIREAYGMTESSSIGLTAQSDDHHKRGSVGTLRNCVYGKVIDLETGKSLGPNQSGELLFKGPNIMKGYVNNPKATNEMIDEHGWLHTGDIGYYDNNQEWFIIDRLKELIKYKGHQVAPAELEAVLLQHPKICDAAVIGLPDETAGEVPLAFVVKKKVADVTEKEIIEFVNEKVSPIKRIRGGVRFIDVIPKSPAGKILRKNLRKLLEPKSKL